jgi:hypothetical protein
VGKYMIRPILALDRLFFLEPEGKVSYRHGENGAKQETMDYVTRARSWFGTTACTPTPIGGR